MNNIGIVFICLGFAFNALACLGLLRLRDTYAMIALSVKCASFGTSLILLGAAFILGPASGGGIKCLLAIALLAVTAPTAAHATARAAAKASKGEK